MSLASNPLTFAIIILAALLLLLLGAYFISSRRAPRASRVAAPGAEPASTGRLKAPGGEEEIASPAAETIEALAQERLRKHADLAGVRLDFGTGRGGDLEIWVNSERFTSIDAIPDERIRSAIQEAVEAFNQGASGGGDQ
ncbi:MAG: hypothetical protein ACK2TX_05960 [Anaerolineales bacterium]